MLPGSFFCAGGLAVSNSHHRSDYLTYAMTAAHNWEDTMRYLCLIYDEEKTLNAMTKADSEAFMGEYFAFSNDIKGSGHYLAGEALQGVETATSVRIRNGKLSTTDGPFAETKEQLGGFYLIKAADLNEALQIASRIPSARLGTVEVRPVVEFG